MKNIVLFIFAFFVFNAGMAQTGCCPYLSPIVVLPASSTSSDFIRIATHTASPSLGNKIFYQHNISNDTILLTGCFYGGPLTAIQDYFDTTNVGILGAGVYKIIYTAYMTPSPTDCNSKTDTSILLSTFIVSAPNFVSSVYQDIDFIVYPNPASDKVVVKAEASNYDLCMYDVAGRKILDMTFFHQLILNTKDIPKGMYIVKLSNELKIQSRKLVIE